MKKLTLILLICAVISGCKKTNNGPVAMQVRVTGLTAKTALSLKITNNSQGDAVILNLVNQYGNTTYTTTPVSPGDQLYMTYSTNIPDDLAGNGDGTIEFIYKGQNMGSASGVLTGQTHDTVPMP